MSLVPLSPNLGLHLALMTPHSSLDCKTSHIIVLFLLYVDDMIIASDDPMSYIWSTMLPEAHTLKWKNRGSQLFSWSSGEGLLKWMLRTCPKLNMLLMFWLHRASLTWSLFLTLLDSNVHLTPFGGVFLEDSTDYW